MRGVYEAWGLPGEPLTEGKASAFELKPIGGFVIICNSFRKFRIYWHSAAWVVQERWAIGTTHVGEEWQYMREFSSLKEARAFTLGLTKDSAIEGANGSR